MNNKKILLSLLLGLTLLLGGLARAESDVPAATQAPAPAVQTAPDFIVYDGEGNPVRLHDYIGKPIVLNFWASWCGPCKSEMPDFQAAYEKYGSDVHFLMVNLTDGSYETRARADEFLAQAGYTFPVLYDQDSYAAYVYQVSSIPTTYFLSAEGGLIAYGQGALDMATLERGLEMIMP